MYGSERTACALVKVVVSGTGSRFLLCRKSQEDSRFPKYPPQPVRGCPGYRAVGDAEQGDAAEA